MKYLFILCCIFLTGCSYLGKSDERAVARVGDDYLYESDLTHLVTPGTSPTDSLSIIQNYIESWLQRRAIIHQARKNLTEEQLDFADALEDYQNSLIIYAYENLLVGQRLDTVVSDEEIEMYYLHNQNNFQLKDNIVRMSYVKIPVGSNELSRIRRLFFSGDSNKLVTVSDICDKQGFSYAIDNGEWHVFADVIREIPVTTYNQEDFLKYRRTIELQDSAYTYFVLFNDFKIKESISPLQFENDRIRSIILNKRKMELLHSMRRSVYEEALKKNDIEVY